ncbi:hypothetical protein [Archangium violaceum]|uniref:hypothetical protein n=1 Tax=Archangium violaceum TaxID=83451 RepID=UPI0036DAD316
MVIRGTERTTNPSLVLSCDGASLVFQAEALSLGFQVGIARCRVTDRQTHKRKLRTFANNKLKFQTNNQMSSMPNVTDHTWNTWESLHIDLTARQFGFQGTYHIGTESFLSDIETNALPVDHIDPFGRWTVSENDLPEFRAWRASGLDWEKMRAWDISKREAYMQKFEEFYHPRKG